MTRPILQLDPAAIAEVAELVTSVLLGVHAVPIAPPAGASELLRRDDVWTGCVAVTGSFCGAVSLACSSAFVRDATRALLGADASDGAETARDVLAELTNVIGGNLKPLLSDCAECQLSIPVVSQGALDLPNAQLVRHQWCDCNGEQLAIGVWQALPDRAERPRLCPTP
jgi:CheY-specific phosphatase CheX